VAYALLHAVTLVLAPGRLPVFTSDGLDLYFYATLAPARSQRPAAPQRFALERGRPPVGSAGVPAHFGQWVADAASRKLRWRVALDLLYGQVKKSYRRRRLDPVERRRRLGDLAHLTERLKALGFSGTLNTAFVERINLTLRHALAAVSRRSWATAQLTGDWLAHREGWRAYPQGAFGSYHFCRPHFRGGSSSRCRKHGGESRRHAGMGRAPQRHLHCTAGASVAAGLTDPLGSGEELLAFPVGQ
jgi:hypothetical protein